MLNNYFKITFRNFRKHKAFSVINILGLTIGLVVCIFILLYVRYEQSYDKFNNNYESIYRIGYHSKVFNHDGLVCPAILGPTLKKNYPEIDAFTRIEDPSWFQPKVLLKYNEKQFYEENYLSVEQSFFEIFNFSFVEGDVKNAFKDPHSIVLTKELAEKYFGDSNPVGKVMRVNNTDLTVTGILKNVPSNSHIQFRFLTGIVFDSYPGNETSWNNWNYHTYIRLKAKSSSKVLEKKIFDLPGKYSENNKRTTLSLMPLVDIHLHSHSNNELGINGNSANIYIFSALAILILFIACINFMNLSTARSSKRITEIGLRKVVGANRNQIVKQFIGESITLTFISFTFAIIIIVFLLPFFNNLSDTKVELSDLLNWPLMLCLFLMMILTGIIAGSYPAFYLSSFSPINALKKSVLVNSNRNTQLVLRKFLVVFQFLISAALIIGTFTIVKQLHYIQNKELGYSKEQILILPLNDYKSLGKYKVLKEQLMENPSIIKATLSSCLPNDISSSRNFFPESSNRNMMCGSITIDKDFFSTYNIKLLDGKTVMERSDNDETEQFIINETAAKEMNLTSPVGVKMGRGREIQGEIIGLVKDFHFKQLYDKIGPLVMHLNGNPPKYLSIRLRTDKVFDIMGFIKNKFYGLFQDRPLDYFFFDETFNKMYSKEDKFASIIEVFSALSIFISCLGLLGLISYSVESKTKEIGIRKVLGAGIYNILISLTKEFATLILIANIIAIPLAYYALNKWLDDFAYKVELNCWIFILTAVVSCLLAMVTVSYQVFKAAVTNPIESLRYE